MIRRLLLMVRLARPPVIVLLAMFTATGLAQAGHGEDRVHLLRALVVVFGFLVFSVACNDLADVLIDRVNLPGDRGRPLVTGTAYRRDMVVAAATAAVLSLAASLTLHWPAIVAAAAGLAISAAYSLRPARLSARGVVAPLVLPACYVAVPYLTGMFAVRETLRKGDLLLLAGLYVGFIGRILLKDFRDVRGDEMFGKRTFLVRHGRRWTCVFSAFCWTAGTVLLVASVRDPAVPLVVANAALLAAALLLLRALSTGRGPHRDDHLIAALAIVGRGIVLVLLVHLGVSDAHWSAWSYAGVMGTLTAGMLYLAVVMARRGPVITSTRYPFDRAGASERATPPAPPTRPDAGARSR
ncbi:4-hydroxybenzoate polyprenyltransferase [Actinomadura meyerae]|uniref:4-hydroxybenzoate polyprenyltransferase n=1 Tax=Actinomadura meyerae TaxID=240840 RepID=A0A239FAM5_9ACTN|nr:UbiA family prenyltransferase [Actinomadura meyerae]SNS53976.1 4-hydroxybenzoate polyprenyltransferase [Actinomadura meyerae]